MRKLIKKCSICGSTVLRSFGSVKRPDANERRYKCENGHSPSRPHSYVKEICEGWVRYLALKWLEKGNSYRSAEKKVAEYISKTGIAIVLGKKKYSHAAIRKWAKSQQIVSEFNQQKAILDKFLQALPEEDKKIAQKKNMTTNQVIETPTYRDTYRRFKWGEQMKNNIISTLNAAPEFRNLLKDTHEIDWLWCLKMMSEMYEAVDEKPWDEKEKLLKEYPQAIRFFKN